MTRAFRLLSVLAAIVVMAGCSSTKLDEAPIVDKGTASAAQTTAPVTSAQSGQNAVAPVDASALDPLKDPNSPLAKRSVYFDFDSFVVKPEYQSLVEAHAKYLTSHRDRRVTIEGNADERGSREYNLALGQKRADAVKSRLGLLGVPDQQVETISLGAEKPRATGHDEAAWAENRRADIVYK